MNALTNIKTTYSELLQTEEWKRRRNQILQRDGERCCFCESSLSLEVHHRQYHFIKAKEDFKKPWLYEDNNLITICSNCHSKGHSVYKIPVFNV